MLKPKYIFLVLSLIEFAVGFSNAQQNIFFYMGLPVGCILFCLFLIFQMLEKESALYDVQQRAEELARKRHLADQPILTIKQEVAHRPAPTHAHSV